MIDLAHAINALSSSHPFVVEEAIAFLLVRRADAVPALIAALSAGTSAIPAANLLGRLRAVEAMPALVVAERDGGPGLRWEAAQALALIRGEP